MRYCNGSRVFVTIGSFIFSSFILNITIIIPTYNEEGSLEKTIFQLEEVIATLNAHKITVLIFDSHSTDRTPAIVKALQVKFDNIVLETEAKKSGLGSAYVKAMQYAIEHLGAELVFEFDADGSHQPQYIVPMIKAIEEGADVALGSRYVKGGAVCVGWPWYRRLISELGNYIARFFLTSAYKDFTSGFRATKASFLKTILQKPLLSNNYAYKIHLLWALHQAHAKIVEVPIVFIDRESGHSKFPKNNILESLKVVILLRLMAWKLYAK